MNKAEMNNSYLITHNEVIIDISMLYDVAANDEAYVKLMVDTFLQTVPTSLANVMESFENEDYESLYQSAHKMKSSFSIVKINGVLEWLKEIELHAKQKIKSPVLAELIENVNTRFLIARQVLMNKFQSA